MSDTHDESISSLPDLPPENSHGSSVSSDFVNEYDELLKYAIVAPRFSMEPSVYTKTDLPSEENNGDELSLIKDPVDEKDVSFKVNPNYKVELKILEAKKAVEKTSHQPDIVPLNIPNALESLFAYSGTPIKGTSISDHCEPIRSSNSTPESGVCSPSNANVDKGLLRMDCLMDEWCLQLKRNVLAEMVDMKGKQLQNEEIAFAELKCKHNMDIKKLSHEVDSLKELLYSFEQNVKQKDEMIANLTEALNKQKEKSDKIRMFSMWRLKLNDQHRQEFASKMADKFYKKALCSKVWDGWRSVVENKWKVRVEKACQIKSQEVCLKLTEDYEERLQALQRELSNARGDVAQLHTERDCYEENMKKAFMRGVCALNMEAMSMFKDGGGCDDNNSPQYNSHHPCMVPSSTGFMSQQCDRVMSNSINTQTSEELGNRAENSRKHVTFNNQPQYEASNMYSKYNSKANNKKNLHVKMTGKKDKTFGSSRPSSISSIKVERHIPHDIPQQRPHSAQGSLKSNFKNDDTQSDVQSGKRILPKTIKVVD